MKVVLDIETTAFGFEYLSESQQEYILRNAEQEKDETIRAEKREDSIRYLSLYPFTAKVISIGMLNVESEKSLVLFESSENIEWTNEEKQIKYRGLPEKEMLEQFWTTAKKIDQVITFNGRNFDVPFLAIRSAIQKVKPTKNFLANRYDISHHLDLLDQFTFYGLIKKFNLDFYCHSLGIESPKSKGVTGMDVKELYNAGRIKDIAIYCGDDIKATFELYKIWKEYLNYGSSN
ncbi:MAG: 3'-5' exonuclease [Flavobacterium sp.]|nr:3'-5' exonuclease [Flavobacterium sp.]